MIAEQLAYFFDASALGCVFEEWPEDIGLVLCLDESGSCEMLLHHAEEGQGVLKKAGALLGRGAGEFAVVPAMDGYPTRRVMFSDEQKLLALVEGEADIAEMAADYLMNYRFEKARKARERLQAEAARARQAELGPRLIEPFTWRPRLHLSEVRSKVTPKRTPKPKKPDMPEGYLPSQDAVQSECWFADGELRLGDRGVRLALAADMVDIKTSTRLVQEVGFRDDFSRFVLPRGAVDGWLPGEPLVIDIPEDRFPAGLRERFKLARSAEITVTAQGVFVAPGGALAEQGEASGVKEDTSPRRKRRRFLTPVSIAVALLAVAGLTVGTMIEALEADGLPVLQNPPPASVEAGA
ncbi:hypothetical protein J4E08_12155 [Sagittula sp. NFXS13]|uniref:hypothetical protein n=1 Tax=Sagittula sp. NFXS13 TaxID=2819095 RepID=UPI0032E0272B